MLNCEGLALGCGRCWPGKQKRPGFPWPIALPEAKLLLGGVFGLVGHVLHLVGTGGGCVGGTLGGVGGRAGSGVPCSRSRVAGCISSSACRFLGRIGSSARRFLGLFHGGGGGFFRLLAGGQRKGSEKCDEKFGLHGYLPGVDGM